MDRVARGDLERERLVLAAYSGDPRALLLVGEEAAEYASFICDGLGAVHVTLNDELVAFDDLREWSRGLARWGAHAVHVGDLGLLRSLVLRVRATPIRRPAATNDIYEDYEWQEEVLERERFLAAMGPELDATLERCALYPDRRSPSDEPLLIERATAVARMTFPRWNAVTHPISGLLREAAKRLGGDSSPSAHSTEVLAACERLRVDVNIAARETKRMVVAFALR